MRNDALLGLGIVAGLAVLLGRRKTDAVTDTTPATRYDENEELLGGGIVPPVIPPTTLPAILAPGPVVTDTTPATRYDENEELLGGGIVPPVYDPPSNAVTPQQPAVADVRIESFTVSPSVVKPGGLLAISANLRNYGDAPANLRLDGALGVENLLRQWTTHPGTLTSTLAPMRPLSTGAMTVWEVVPPNITPKGYGARVWLYDASGKELGSRVMGEAVLVQPGAEGVR